MKVLLLLLLLLSCGCEAIRKPVEPVEPQTDEEIPLEESDDSEDEEEYEYAYALKYQSSDTKIFICKLKNGKRCNDEFVTLEGENNE
jgi:hypothetical protein